MLKGLSPREAWDSLFDPGNPLVQLSPETRYILANHRRPLKITRNGICVQLGKERIYFRNETTGRLIGSSLPKATTRYTRSYYRQGRLPRARESCRRHAGCRVRLELGARLATGLGPGRGDRDPRAVRRAEDHLGRPAPDAEDRKEPVALRPGASGRRRSGPGDRPSALPRRDSGRPRPVGGDWRGAGRSGRQ